MRPGWPVGAKRAVKRAALVMAGLYLLHALGVGFPMLVGLIVVVGVVAALLPWLGVRALDAVTGALRAFGWRREEGRHHAFAGVALHIEDDGRFVWVDGADLQRVLSTRDADDVLAARHAGRWRRDAEQRLMLRVDAVVERLATAPGRMEPRTVRLRRYFEREVLYPAARRRERAQPAR